MAPLRTLFLVWLLAALPAAAQCILHTNAIARSQAVWLPGQGIRVNFFDRAGARLGGLSFVVMPGTPLDSGKTIGKAQLQMLNVHSTRHSFGTQDLSAIKGFSAQLKHGGKLSFQVQGRYNAMGETMDVDVREQVRLP